MPKAQPPVCQVAGCTNWRPQINGRRYCDECRDRKRRKRDRDTKRAARLTGSQAQYERKNKWRRFGVTPEEVDACVACQACGSRTPGGRWDTWYGDHDHQCCARGCSRCFRGLVCMECNIRRIRVLEDEPHELLVYLARFDGDSAVARVARFLLERRQLRLVG